VIARLALMGLLAMRLSASGPEAVCAARDALRVSMLTASVDQRAAQFRAFRSLYLKSVQGTEPEFWRVMAPYRDVVETFIMNSQGPDPVRALLKARPDIEKAGAAWFRCGYTVEEGEGDLYPAAEPGALLEFAGRLPEDLASYVRFRAREDAQKIGGDAALMLSWEELRARLARWETFAWSYPKLPETASEVQPEIRSLARLYFLGIDNTPTFDFYSGRIDGKVIASWKVFAREDKGSRYHSLAVALLARLADDDGRLTERDADLFAQAGMQEEFNSWLRVVEIQRAEALRRK
jgi:hypothetical protein